jgi:hypothetical protein
MYNIENFLSENILGENITCCSMFCYGKPWQYTTIIAEFLYMGIYYLYLSIGLFLLKNMIRRKYVESILYFILFIVWLKKYNIYFNIN